MVPLKSKDGSVLIKDAVGIMARWTEHFTDLSDNPSATGVSVINGCHKRTGRRNYQSINQPWRPQPSSTPGTPVLVGHEEFQLCLVVSSQSLFRVLTKVALGRPRPLRLCEGSQRTSSPASSSLCLNCLYKETTIMLSLYKGKNTKSNCGDYRVISLLKAIGKVFSKVLWICPYVHHPRKPVWF